MHYKNDNNYAKGRLEGTYLSYRGNVVLVEELGPRTFHYLVGPKFDERMVGNTNDLNLTPIKLGYSNSGNNTSYLLRIPARRWKQGVDQQAVATLSTHHGNGAGAGGKDFQFTHKGQYPDIKHAVDKAEKRNRAFAFSRSFAVLPNKRLEYKGRYVVGKIEGGVPVLSKKYQYLERLLAENG